MTGIADLPPLVLCLTVAGLWLTVGILIEGITRLVQDETIMQWIIREKSGEHPPGAIAVGVFVIFIVFWPFALYYELKYAVIWVITRLLVWLSKTANNIVFGLHPEWEKADKGDDEEAPSETPGEVCGEARSTGEASGDV